MLMKVSDGSGGLCERSRGVESLLEQGRSPATYQPRPSGQGFIAAPSPGLKDRHTPTL